MDQHSVSVVAVLGAGSWGTALALLLARNGHATRLWGHNPDHVTRLRNQRENRRYLSDHRFPSNLTVHTDLTDAMLDADLVLVVVPSQAYGVTVQRVVVDLSSKAGFAWATKGLEHGTGRFLHQVTCEILGKHRAAAMVSGPSFAREVAAGLPTAITVASPDTAHARRVAALLHGPTMRAYTSADITGVEIGGAVKNVLAIAAGVADGLGFGANARAALITRGLAEMVRLGEAVGGRRETFMGLTGVGDLVLTCTDNQSRNRRFGLAIGKGGTADEAQAAIGQVVEGAIAARELMRLARQHGVDMPITDQVDHILHHGQPPRQAVETLLAREPKAESI
jgi:glycerol-3-phosphate dehydrogenase (NAD(P)+)